MTFFSDVGSIYGADCRFSPAACEGLRLGHSRDPMLPSSRKCCGSDPFSSAMSMLVFCVNRAGRNLDPQQKTVLERAKDELYKLCGRAPAKPRAGVKPI